MAAPGDYPVTEKAAQLLADFPDQFSLTAAPKEPTNDAPKSPQESLQRPAKSARASKDKYARIHE